MKRLIFLISFIVFCLFIQAFLVSKLSAQIPGKKERRFLFGAEIGFGIINPKDINTYIFEYYNDEGFNIEERDADLNLNLVLGLNMRYYFTKNLELKGAFDFSLATSSVQDVDMIGMDNDRLNIFLNLAPSVVCNYHIYVDIINSIYLGGGLASNNMTLNVNSDDNTYKAKGIGPKINVGFMLRKPRFPMYIEIEYNLSKAKTKPGKSNNNYSYVSVPEKLNYSGINFKYGIKF